MAFYRSPIVVAEPYEDSQGPESPTETSPEELKAFYDDMERREILERKLSKRKSNSGTSIWSRKSLKRSTTSPPVHPTPADLPRVPSTSNLQENDQHEDAGYSSETMERNSMPRLATSRSVIGGGTENPAWAENGPWAAVPLPTFKVKYPLHNPMGPRWYKNHHLIPPSQKRPSMRPPTFFSPSFPPMHTSSSPEHVDDSAGSSRTLSHSPLPTPTSSQTRVGDGGKSRSRKTSQTTPDTVDLLDVTDPWGQNWHHQSPYDIGQTTTTVSSDAYDIPNRRRRASMTAMQSRHMSVNPSPLSQSTSAVHLHPLQPEIHIPRKLSKRRTTPAVANIFGSQPGNVDRKAASAPATPIEHIPVAPPQEFLPSDSTSLPKRMSVAPAPPLSVMQQTPKKEKRGSMLNRLAKKFSILKKGSDDHEPASDWWHHIDTNETKGYVNVGEPVLGIGRLSPEKPHRDSVKRVPPPSVDYTAEPVVVEPPPVDLAPQADDRASLASLEAPYSMGRLTIANPDLPDTEAGTPLPNDEAPLPPEKPREISESQSHIDELPSVQSPPQQPSVRLRRDSSEMRLRLDKPLPPPQMATPEFAQLRLSDVHAAHAVEQALSLPSRASSPHDTPADPPPVPQHSPPRNPRAASPPPLPQTDPTQPDPTPSDRSQILSPLVQSRVVPETPRRSPSGRETISSPNDTPTHVETPVADRSRTQSPPVPPLPQNESPKKMSSQSRSKRSVDPPSTTRIQGTDRNSHAQALANPYHPRDRSAEASSSTHQSKKPNRSHSRSDPAPVPAPALIPFPTTRHVPTPAVKEMEYEGSPLSTSSMLANPPTPYDHRLSIATSDQSGPTLPPKSIYEGKSPQKPAAANPSPARQTETFKLVRSSSGNVYASGETITAAGQQWEVVESVEAKGRKEKPSSKSKDKEPEHRPRDQDYRPKDYEQKSRDSVRKSKDYEQRPKDERKSRDYEHKSKDQEQRPRDEHRAREEHRARDEHRAKEEHRPKDEHRAKDEHRSRDEQRPKDEHKSKDEHRSRDQVQRPRDEHRSRDQEQKSRDEYKARDYERSSKDVQRRSKEEQRSREYERKSKDYEPKPKDEYKPRDYEPRSKEQDYRSKDHDRRSTDYERASRDHHERRSKDYDYDGRPEPKRESKSKLEVDNNDYYRSSHRSSKQPIHYQEEPPKSRSNVIHRHEEPSRYEEKSSRKREEYRERKPERKHTADTSSSSNHHAHNASSMAQPVYVQPIYVPLQPSNPPPPPTLRLERNPSITARPTSELPSAADMNAMRAKESWEMERLWKARSMYGLEPNAPTNNVIPGSSSSSSISDDAPTHGAVYGSSHTSYVVQTPFQGGLGNQIYHSMPTAPPPIIYSSPASIPSIPDSISSYEPYDYAYRSYPAASPPDFRTPPPMPRPPLSNPLPEPPREATFELKGLKTAKPSNRHSNDYWTKYNGITTAH